MRTRGQGAGFQMTGRSRQAQRFAGFTGLTLGLLQQPAADFVIQSQHEHGLSGLINLFGIESPGLTASLAIAERIARLL